MSHRSPLIAEVLRDRNALYRETDEGIENGYTLKLVNKTDQPQQYTIRIQSQVARLRLRESPAVEVAAGSVAAQPVTLVAPASTAGRHDLQIIVRAADGTEKIVDSSFFGPMP